MIWSFVIMQNKENNIDISKGTIEQANLFFSEIPEFTYTHPIEEFHKRLNEVPHLILSAYVDNNVVGIFIKFIPLLSMLAINPVKSPVIPPPILIIKSDLLKFFDNNLSK